MTKPRDDFKSNLDVPKLRSIICKQIIRKGMQQRARLHIGRNGVTRRIKRLFSEAWLGTCLAPYPTDILRVKIQPSYTGSPEDIAAALKQPGIGYAGQYWNNLIFFLF